MCLTHVPLQVPRTLAVVDEGSLASSFAENVMTCLCRIRRQPLHVGRQGHPFFVVLVAVIEDQVVIPEQVIVVFPTRPVFSVTPCVVAVVSKYAPSSGLWSLVDPRNHPHFISLAPDDLHPRLHPLASASPTP